MVYNQAPPGAPAAKPPHGRLLPRVTMALHLVVCLTSLSIAFCLFDNSLFAWHPAMMSIAYLAFMTEGIVASIQFRSIDGPERVKAIWGHALLQARAFVCLAIGFGVIYRNKVLHGKPHFVSLHAKFGLATLILSTLLPLWGLVSFRRLGIIQRFPERLQPVIKMLHRRLGLLTWLLALATIELALPHPAVNKGLLTRAWQAGVAVLGALVLLLGWKSVPGHAAHKGGQPDDTMAKTV